MANSPDRYTVHVQLSDYHVPPDGRVLFQVSTVRTGCSIDLFGIPIRIAPDASKQNPVSIMAGGAPVRLLSLRELSKLPLDSAGYHQLPISGRASAHGH